MSIQFHIKSPKSVIERIIKIASRYTDQETGAPAYLKSILLEADKDGKLTITAESQYSAIQIEQEKDIEVVQAGELIVRANWLITSLDTVQPDEDVDLSYVTGTNGKPGRIHLNHVDMAPPVIGDKALKPSVGEADTSNGIKMAPEAFAETYLTASVARSFQSSKMLLQGVLAETSTEESVLRLMSFDGFTTLATDSLDVDIIGEGAGEIIFKDESVRSSLDYIKQGNSVELFRDEQERVHAIVRGKDGITPFHIRLATLDYDTSKFRATRLRDKMKEFAASISFNGRVEKAELLRVMRNSSNIGSLDLSDASIGGQARYVRVRIEDGNLISSVVTNASYEESIAIETEGDDKPTAEFRFPFGLTGNLFEAYHNENDPQNLQVAFLKKSPDADPHAIILYKDSVYKEDGETLSEYFCVTSVSPANK